MPISRNIGEKLIRTKPGAWPRRLMTRFGRDRSGGVLMLVGALMPVLLGVSALGMDASSWYMERRILQNESDLGALGGAHQAATSNDTTLITNAVDTALSDNDYTTQTGDSITVNSPPTSGSYAGKSGYVEVIMQRKAKLLLAAALLNSAGTIKVRSVAGSVSDGEHCVLSLNDTTDKALEFTGTANVTLGCGVAANSNSDNSIYIGGTANLTADPAQTFGDIYVGGSASLTTNHPVRTYAQKVTDPYGPDGRNLTMPDIGSMACTYTQGGAALGGTVDFPANSVYCGGLKLSSSAHVTFEPGPHYFYGGSISCNGCDLTGDGVTLFLSGPDSGDITTLDVTGNADLNLSAQTPSQDPTYAGILVFQDPIADSYQGGNFITNSFLGSTSSDLLGAIYMPNQEIKFSGGSGTANACLQVIGTKVTFQGSSVLKQEDAACDALGVAKIAQVRIKLVE